jgi:uncharacterized protein YegP (UPF0339 family)
MNDPRFEVYPRKGEATDHTTVAHDDTEYLPGGEVTVCTAHCEACDWTAKGDPADTRDAASGHEHDHPREFGWRFRAGNGQISAIGGEGFTRREDAHRAVSDFIRAVIDDPRDFPSADKPFPPIIDVDE